MRLHKELPRRKPNRLKGYDYSKNGSYFITICIKEKYEMLGKIINGQSILSEYGLVVKQEIENISTIRKECVIKKFVIMPNHIHLIVKIVGNDGDRSAKPRADCGDHRADCHPPLRKSISNMVQGLKGAVTRQIGFSIWQKSFYDHIIRNETEYRQICEYIKTNLLKWAEDCFYVKPDENTERKANEQRCNIH